MSVPSGPYTLYYSLRSPFSADETGHEDQFDNIIDALSRASLVLEQGGNPTHLIYDDAVLFSGDDLKEALKRVSDDAASGPLGDAVLKTLPEVLIKQLAKTVKFSHEHFGAVTVYRSMLEELYEAADQAIQKKDLELLYRITGKLAFWYVPGEGDVKQWGKDFLYAYRRDAGWLHDTKKALEKIETAVKELDVTDGSRNAELKEQILEAAEKGLITHV